MSLELVSETNPKDEHNADIETILWYSDRLISGSDNGIVKVWTSDLDLVTQFQAHDGQPVYDMSIDPVSHLLYTCSPDTTIQEWKLEDGKCYLNNILKGHTQAIRKLCFSDGILYSGDEAGEVKLWKNGDLINTCNMIEEVWDLKVHKKQIFTVRDRDVVINEFNDGLRRCWTRKHIPGRGPLLLLQEDRICFPDRNGTCLLVHGSSTDGFPQLGTLQGHSMTINALTGRHNVIFSGGWDKRILAWDLDKMISVGEFEIGNSITSMTTGPHGQVYVTGERRIYQLRTCF